MTAFPEMDVEYKVLSQILGCKVLRTFRMQGTENPPFRFLGTPGIVMSKEILENVANFQRRGSGCIFRTILSTDIHLNKYEPLSGSSYIPLPKVLQSKKAIVNVKNEEDNECFKWSFTTAIYPAENHPDKKCVNN